MTNRIRKRGDTAWIEMRHKGKRVLAKIDARDVGRVLAIGARWHLRAKGQYVAADVGRKCVYLHRLIARTPPGMMTDHRNHDTLDNRSRNLRNVTRTENQRHNRGAHVFFRKDRPRRPWMAYIGFGGRGKQKYLGAFRTKSEALEARMKAEKKYWGGICSAPPRRSTRR